LCMSRRELAEAANAYVWYHANGRNRTNMTEHDIGRYGRGEVHWPGPWRQFGLRGVLGASNDAELGVYPNRKHRTPPAPSGGTVPDGQDEARPTVTFAGLPEGRSPALRATGHRGGAKLRALLPNGLLRIGCIRRRARWR